MQIVSITDIQETSNLLCDLQSLVTQLVRVPDS